MSTRPLSIPQPMFFYDEGALLERLLNGLQRRNQEVVFVLGSGLSAPVASGKPGVPTVNGVIELIRREFEGDRTQLALLDKALADAGASRYQAAFVFLQGRRGQQTANEIVRTAVLGAWISGPANISGISQTRIEDTCRVMDFDLRGWSLNPGTEAVGKLVTSYPDLFGKSILTTNFDPLLEVSIRRAGGQYFRTVLHSDGNLSQTEGMGCHVIHLHGYWHGSDTLHTSRQLTQQRPRLRVSLAALLRNKLVVVCAYGGWDDAFTDALVDIVRDDSAYPEIIWTFHGEGTGESLLERLTPGVDRGRIALYASIDCNTLLPRLYNAWSILQVPPPALSPGRSNPVHVTQAIAESVLTKPRTKLALEGDDEDRPPVIDLCIGRERELLMIKESPARVIFITGIGGQGKSTIAAQYFADSQLGISPFIYFVWRDCKEESERFEIQLASVIEKLSEGMMTGEDLARQTAESIVGLLINFITDREILFVFDNVDHYTDLESKRLIGSAELLVEALQKCSSKSRVVFTCRPSVYYPSANFLNIPLEGIQLASAEVLFAKRGASSSRSEIEAAHVLTEGHAFWLDLLAIQAAQGTFGRDLKSILAEIRAGGGPLPAKTLNSIWSTLKEREQVILRAMAETVKPETESHIADYLSDLLHYNKVAKGLRTLRSLNLIVLKRRSGGTDLLELHPLVRQFIRQSFAKADQASFINGIIRVYKKIIGQQRSHLTERPSLSLLQYWTQDAELDIAIGNVQDAFSALGEVGPAFDSCAYPRELARAVRLVLSVVDWVSQHAQYELFESIFARHIRILAYLGEIQEVDELLLKYELTVPNRDTRYVGYCEMRAFCLWVRNDFVAAVRWGTIGQGLVESSDVDSQFTFRVRYTLALAHRDAGQPEAALIVFLDGRPMSEAIDPEELDENRGEHHYGNIGRCLHFMGQIESALVCYQKSALIIERNQVSEHVMNQGYIRRWIGELLMGREEYELAAVFLRAAVQKWQQVAPPKALEASALLSQAENRAGILLQANYQEAEQICLDWILGRNVEIGSGVRLLRT